MSNNTTNTTHVQSASHYIVKKNNRRIPNKVFESYEKARQWVRRKLRSMREAPGFIGSPGSLVYDPVDRTHRTPQLNFHGYSISKQEG